MNDYKENLSQYEILEQEVKRLKEENLFLKEELRKANLKVTGLNSLSDSSNLEHPLVEYYSNRYLEIHNFVLSSRVAIIDEDILKAQEEYDLLTSREDMLELIASKNASIQEKINEIDERIIANEEKLSTLKTEFEKEADEVTTKENNIYFTTTDYYNNLLSKLSIGNNKETNEYMSFVIDVLKYTLYDEVVKYVKDAKCALDTYDRLNVLEYEVKNENNSLTTEKEELSKGIEIISFEETEKKLDSLAYEIANKKKAKEELGYLFEKLKNENLKNIKDEIKHFQILEYNNQTIAMKMDDIILGYKDSLSVSDTPSNVLFSKKLQLQKLNEQMEQIYPYKEKLDRVNSEYTHLQNMHDTIEKNINNIEEYISKAKKVIENSTSFKKTIKEYTESKVRLSSIEASLENVMAREKSLASTRKEILHTPYGKTDLIKIDEELRQVQDTITSFTNEKTSLQTRIYQLKDTPQDAKIIAIYDEYKTCEQKLPDLYEKQSSLSVLISDKYIALSNLKSKCSNYEELKEQIEALEDEIANL